MSARRLPCVIFKLNWGIDDKQDGTLSNTEQTRCTMKLQKKGRRTERKKEGNELILEHSRLEESAVSMKKKIHALH